MISSINFHGPPWSDQQTRIVRGVGTFRRRRSKSHLVSFVYPLLWLELYLMIKRVKAGMRAFAGVTSSGVLLHSVR